MKPGLYANINNKRARIAEGSGEKMRKPGAKGAPTAKGEVHATMNEKRFKKMLPLKTRRDLFRVEGDPDAQIGLVSWGSVAGVAIEAVRAARRTADGTFLAPESLEN